MEPKKQIDGTQNFINAITGQRNLAFDQWAQQAAIATTLQQEVDRLQGELAEANKRLEALQPKEGTHGDAGSDDARPVQAAD